MKNFSLLKELKINELIIVLNHKINKMGIHCQLLTPIKYQTNYND
jgi:hypothetical protein